MWLVIGVVGLILVLVVASAVVCFGLPSRAPSPREQAARAFHRAEDAVDSLFREARIAMEEAAGRRRPGERRFQDTMRGSWRDW